MAHDVLFLKKGFVILVVLRGFVIRANELGSRNRHRATISMTAAHTNWPNW